MTTLITGVLKGCYCILPIHIMQYLKWSELPNLEVDFCFWHWFRQHIYKSSQ